LRELPPSFVARDATVVAPALLGKLIELGTNGALVRITEVEAYTADDPASHSFRGRSTRNATMFGPAGHLYVYFIYGVHHCANVVTGDDGDGQAVLIRSVVVPGVDPKLTNGPGKLTKLLDIDLRDDGAAIRVFDDGAASPEPPLVTARIGITKAADLPRRWVQRTWV
jgi:DNA-3-methyladenine glycosylase